MAITHEEARKLIQFKADEALKEFDRNLLENHLRSCGECQVYETKVLEMESTLRPLLQRKWNQSPLPYSRPTVVLGDSKRYMQSIFFATRILAMGLICIAFLFNIWQFNRSEGQGPIQPSANIPLIPTPSLQSTQTKITDQKCKPIEYVVQQGDTLMSIAVHFSVSTEEIRYANQLKNDSLKQSMSLSIPACSPTPSGTPKIVNTTYTPLLGSNTLTPVTGSTQ